MKPKILYSTLFILAMALAACSAPATATATVVPTAMPEASATSGTGQVALMSTLNAQLGTILVDSKGMTLYLYTNDTPNTSTCTDTCAQNWPPLLTTGAAMADTGADASRLGTTTRSDGSTQVTYNGWPLYYFAGDSQPGDTNGEGKNGVWFAISPAGEKVEAAGGTAAAPASGSTSMPTAEATTMATTTPTVMTSSSDLGTFLVDSAGMSLYLFASDSPNTSTCADTCAQNWPPLTVSGSPAAGGQADSTMLGTITRADGSTQVTYNGWPLYHFASDTKPGDTNGEGVSGKWFLVSPSGDQVQPPA